MTSLTWTGARLGHLFRQHGWRTAAAGCVMLAGMVTLLAPWLSVVPGVHRALAALGCSAAA
jgi:hypothetical protein